MIGDFFGTRVKCIFTSTNFTDPGMGCRGGCGGSPSEILIDNTGDNGNVSVSTEIGLSGYDAKGGERILIYQTIELECLIEERNSSVFLKYEKQNCYPEKQRAHYRFGKDGLTGGNEKNISKPIAQSWELSWHEIVNSYKKWLREHLHNPTVANYPFRQNMESMLVWIETTKASEVLKRSHNTVKAYINELYQLESTYIPPSVSDIKFDYYKSFSERTSRASIDEEYIETDVLCRKKLYKISVQCNLYIMQSLCTYTGTVVFAYNYSIKWNNCKHGFSY